VKAKNRTVKDIQRGNRELLQKNARLETRIKELNDELMRTYRRCDFKAMTSPTPAPDCNTLRMS
jgi:cell division protein FtsB